MPFNNNVGEKLEKWHKAKVAANARKAAPFDDHRGSKNLAGWWIGLEEAKQRGMDEEWWTETETETSDSKPVAIPKMPPSDGNKTKNKSNNKKGGAAGGAASPSLPQGPIWLYKNGNMYLGPWRETRNGPGGRLARIEYGYGVAYKDNGNCYVGQFQNGAFNG